MSPPHHQAPQRRRYRWRPETKPERDVMVQITALMSAFGGFFFGSIVGMTLAYRFGFSTGLGFLTGGAVAAYASFLIAKRVVQGTGRAIEKLSDGATTPHTPDYSFPESLVMQGDFTKAIEAYEELLWASPDAPDPYVRIARLYRDKLNQAEEAEDWFQRARDQASVTAGLDLLITQELIELYLHSLGEPRKAIPELAHLCRAHPGTPAAHAAEQELQELREMLAREAEGDESVTEQYLKKHAPRRKAGENGSPF